jgi:hypothetical protein
MLASPCRLELGIQSGRSPLLLYNAVLQCSKNSPVGHVAKSSWPGDDIEIELQFLAESGFTARRFHTLCSAIWE